MIALVIAAVLATAAVDTTMRVPGTSMRFGMESGHFGAAQGFTPVASGLQPGREGREGSMRFFGIESRATLQFENRRLVEAAFVIDDASPHQISYLEDDLLRRGFRRRCPIAEEGRSVCEYESQVNVRLEVLDRTVNASVVPGRPIFAWPDTTAPDTLAPVVTRAPAEAPVYPDTLTLEVAPGSQRVRVLRAPGRPVFPPEARRAGVQGIVTILALVDTTGFVMETVIRRGIVELNAAAHEAAREYVFGSLVVDDRKVRYWVELPIRFTLH